MLLSRDHKFAFIHTPKTAGSSMAWSLAPFCINKRGETGLPQPPAKRRRRGWQTQLHAPFKGKIHLPFREVRKYIPRDYFTFAFVRNPFEMAYSSWARNVEGSLWDRVPKTFERYIWQIAKRKARTLHSRWTQWQYLSLEGEIGVDFVGRFENLQEDWAKVCQEIGIEIYLPRLNQTEERDTSQYREHYTPKMREFMEKKYRKDLEVFGYEF